MNCRSTRLLCLAGTVLILGVFGACREPAAGPDATVRRPLVVIGIDGGEWTVIRQLWSEGGLPHLKALAERGLTSELRTQYNASPVIWTTIATGMRPAEHGIVDFVVPTPHGDVPVSSTVRRVPAIWNMLTRAGRKVAVLGWWASWPAEEVRGLVVSDRAMLDVEQRVFPAEYLPQFLAESAAAREEENPFIGNAATRERDHTLAHLGRKLAAEDYELLLVYFRGVDVVCHNFWKYYQPEAFPRNRPSDAELAAYGDHIPREYAAVDRAIGRILEAADPEPNVLVISDHGFKPARREIVKVGIDFDGVLERLGYLVRDRSGVDLTRSRLTTWASPKFRRTQWLRFALAGREEGDRVRPGERQAIRSQLKADLARITFGNGQPAFRLREARPGEAKRGADLVVQVQSRSATPELLLDGDSEPLAGLITEVHHISGTHAEHTHGILIAAGPDIDPAAQVAGIHIHDIAPTLLYGLGLPVAENFAGRPWVELFSAEFRRANPLRSIAAWGPVSDDGSVSTSEHDEALLRDLAALGYLD